MGTVFFVSFSGGAENAGSFWGGVDSAGSILGGSGNDGPDLEFEAPHSEIKGPEGPNFQGTPQSPNPDLNLRSTQKRTVISAPLEI